MHSYEPHALTDLEVGQTFETPRRTITEADVATFAGVSGDYTRLHTDAVGAGQSTFGERIVHGPLTFACATGLLLGTGVLAGTIEAFLGLDRMRLPNPVYPGDTISVTAEVAEIEQIESRDDAGIVALDSVVRLADGTTVLETVFRFMVRRTHAATETTEPTESEK